MPIRRRFQTAKITPADSVTRACINQNRNMDTTHQANQKCNKNISKHTQAGFCDTSEAGLHPEKH